MSYAEKLKDPRWQRRRLEVLKAADFACESCGDKENTLHVHHPYYAKGKQPWEYDNLVCLCETCHREIETQMRAIAEVIPRMPPADRRHVHVGFVLAGHSNSGKGKAVSDGIRQGLICQRLQEAAPTMSTGEQIDLAVSIVGGWL